MEKAGGKNYPLWRLQKAFFQSIDCKVISFDSLSQRSDLPFGMWDKNAYLTKSKEFLALMPPQKCTRLKVCLIKSVISFILHTNHFINNY